MTKQEFRNLVENKKVILDGATGSNLQKRGMPTGVCPEQWILEHSDVLCTLQKEYIRAGTNILYAPTFSGNRIKLEEYGLENEIKQMNYDLVAISKRAIQEEGMEGNVFVAGDITMTGKQVEPLGPLSFETLVDIYKEQIKYLDEAGADCIVVETMMSLQECRAAVIAAKETTDLPVMVSLSFNEDGRTLFGTDAPTAALTLTTLGADAIGVNCSTGPDKLHGILKAMKQYTNLPLIAKPNAGLPQMVDGETVYDMEPEKFAEEMVKLAELGVDILGGCCGTTPEHIRKMTELLAKENLFAQVDFVNREGVITRALCSERATKRIELDGNFIVVGERINPTGKKALQEQLRQGSFEMVTEMAESQEEYGAGILDVNMGMNGIDEKETMLRAIKELSVVTDLPLAIDSSHVDVVEAALRIYPGRGLINSISLEKEKFEKLLPIAKKYGAMFILLPLSDKGLPKDMEEKRSIIHTIMEEALAQGLTREHIIVDGLVATVGANKRAALETFETISYCKNELGVATICGLSNISFGLPERIFVNSAFLTMAIQAGLTMAIANPSQDLLMHAMYASDLLMNKQDSDIRYIERVAEHKLSLVSGELSEDAVIVTKKKEISGTNDASKKDQLFQAVVKGRKEKVLELVQKKIDANADAQSVIDESLIPAITEVGRLFDEQIYFLPQLIASAEAMEGGIKLLEPLLGENTTENAKATIVIATVEHDIHDIGKNLVALMLRNYGYRVIDLGKDVPAETIVDRAKKENAEIIALSALMTTTMMEMKTVVTLAKNEIPNAKIMIGGAVITQGFADEIGADGYSKDAQAAVELVEKLLGE